MSTSIRASEQPDRHHKSTDAAIAVVLSLILLILTLFGPLIAPCDPLDSRPEAQFAAPSSAHWLGTDELGRDILSRFLWGARSSLGSAILATLMAVVLGSFASLFAMLGYRLPDRVLGYALDVMLAFPGLLIALIAMALLGQGAWQISVAVGISLAPTVARLIRGASTSVSSQPYIGASYALGAGRGWVASRHVARNIIPPLMPVLAVILSWALVSCTGLELIGLAGSPENPTWGGMIGAGRAYFRDSPWQIIAPGLALSLSVLGLSLLGDLKRALADWP